MSDIKKDLIKYTPREEQQRVHDFIFKLKKEKPEIKFFLLNLPTGVGKSHLAMMIANEYISKIDASSKCDIITASKILQDQYANSYDSVTDLKGKENYKCHQYSCSCAQGMEFNKLNKTSCDFCPYESAKQSYLGGKVSLTNFYLYLIYAIYNPKMFESRGSKVLIVDECHDFDDVMSDFISIKITEVIIKRLKFTNEYQILKDFNKVKNIDQYIKFLKDLNTEIIETIDSIGNTMSSGGRSVVSDKRDLKINKLTGGSNQDIKLMQIITDLKQYQLKIEVFLKEFEINPENWVLETSVNEKTKSKELSLEPIWAYDYLHKYVWSHYDMIVLMSGTILNKQIFSELNGISSDSSVYYSMPSPFPLKHRPIYYLPAGKMSYTKKEETFKKYVPLISRIVKKYTGKKGIIHTNSFELAEWIKNDVEEPRLVFHGSDDKMEVLQLHFDSEKDTVIVSPSLHTGVSFDNDKARFQVIAKIPYPSLASQKNKLRQKTKPEWYAWKTCVNLQQSFGRINRNKNDFGDTIVIDESFSDVLKYSSHFIPQWVQESIKRIELK
jgi:Rad3-related DNA helicase